MDMQQHPEMKGLMPPPPAPGAAALEAQARAALTVQLGVPVTHWVYVADDRDPERSGLLRNPLAGLDVLCTASETGLRLETRETDWRRTDDRTYMVPFGPATSGMYHFAIGRNGRYVRVFDPETQAMKFYFELGADADLSMMPSFLLQALAKIALRGDYPQTDAVTHPMFYTTLK